MKESEKERKIILYEHSLKLEYKKKQGRCFFFFTFWLAWIIRTLEVCLCSST